MLRNRIYHILYPDGDAWFWYVYLDDHNEYNSNYSVDKNMVCPGCVLKCVYWNLQLDESETHTEYNDREAEGL